MAKWAQVQSTVLRTATAASTRSAAFLPIQLSAIAFLGLECAQPSVEANTPFQRTLQSVLISQLGLRRPLRMLAPSLTPHHLR